MLLTNLEIENLGEEFSFNAFENKKILITGGSGMIGSFLAEAILRTMALYGKSLANLTVTSLSGDFSNITKLSKLSQLNLIKTDLRNVSEFEQFHYIVHCASPSNISKIGSKKNLKFANEGAIQSLAKSGTESITFLSSGEIYGECKTPAEERFAANMLTYAGREDYPRAKIAGELAVRNIGLKSEANVNIIRLFHTFGPGVRVDDGRSFADFLYSVARGEQPRLKSQGTQIRSFMYSLDSIRGMLTCLLAGKKELICNVGSDIPMSILEFANVVSRVGGLEGVTQVESKTYQHSPFNTLIPSTSLLRSMGWAPKVSLETGVRQSLSWIRRQS